jgi:hypothetical protein
METFQKRQKAWARKEKQQKKAARRMERRIEKAAQSQAKESQPDGGGPAQSSKLVQHS